MKIIAARQYKGDVVKMVWGGKYSGTPRNGFLDAEDALALFAEQEPAALGDPAVVVHVPGRLHGKTHALAPRLAQVVADALGIPAADVLERTREAPPMRRMGREERKRHVKGLYRVAEGWRPDVKGARILVVDDVSTTGATLNECGRVLLEAGAASVVGLVLAKVGKPKKEKGAAMPTKKKPPKKKPKDKKPAKPKPKRYDVIGRRRPEPYVDPDELRTYRISVKPTEKERTSRIVRTLNRSLGRQGRGVAWAWVPTWGPDVVEVDVQARTSQEAQDIVTGILTTKPKRRKRRW